MSVVQQILEETDQLDNSAPIELPATLYVQTTNEAMHKMIERSGPAEASVKLHYLLLCRVIVSTDQMSEAAHWLKTPSASMKQSSVTGKTLSVND